MTSINTELGDITANEVVQSKDDDNSKDSYCSSDKKKSISSPQQQNEQNSSKDRRRKPQDKRRKVMYEDDSNLDGSLVQKEEKVSDEEDGSVMSDVNPPSLATRLRVRKTERRGGTKTGSVCDSVQSRAARSEPILITLSDSNSSDDEDYHPAGTPRRLQRNILRRLGRRGASEQEDSGTDSSSSGASVEKKKKKSRKTVQVRKGKKKAVGYALSKRKRQDRILKLRRLGLYEKDYNFTSSYAKKRIQKAKNSPIKRRLPRKCSTASIELHAGPSIKKESTESDQAPSAKEDAPAPARKLGRPRKKKHVSTKEHSEIKNEIDRIRNTPKVESTDLKLTLDTKNMKILAANDLENDESKDGGDDPAADGERMTEKNNEQLDRIKSDLERIRSNTPDDYDDEVDDEENGKSSRKKSDDHREYGKPKPKSHKKSKKNLTGKRGRGRPRLTETIAPITSIPQKPTATSDVDMSSFYIEPHKPFLQSSFCFDVSPKLSKCRECRLAVNRNNRNLYNSYCRFMEYRKICCDKKGQILSAGFSCPKDAKPEDIAIWLPQTSNSPKDLDFETAKSLLEHIGDQFCDLVAQEKEAYNLHIGIPQSMTWKKIVQGVREMCDVCSTTIFNIHWVCPICGFAVCIDCYKVRKQGITCEDLEDIPKDRDDYRWLMCNSRTEHQQDSLIMAEMILESALDEMWTLMHKTREKLGIPAYCKCNPPSDLLPDKQVSSGVNKQLMSQVSKSFYSEKNLERTFSKTDNNNTSYEDLDIEVSGTALKWIDNLTRLETNPTLLDKDNFNNYEDLRLLLKGNLQQSADVISDSETEYDGSCYSLSDVISCVNTHANKTHVKQFNDRYPQPISGRDPLPIRIYTTIESELSFSNVPHSWFCNGRLLFLHQADHVNNLGLFQEQWKRGQPIMVKGVDKKLDMSLWTPKGFCRDFGDIKNDLVDCKTGAILKNLPMRKFWEGFESLNKRLTDENDEPMLLKLKDWPPGEDFSEKLPTRFQDLMKGLPLPEYTHRDGVLNLAGRLPSSFVRPDLGPKMYNAYGSALFPTKGTTNLHLDMSDAVNVMVYVGIPSDGNAQAHIVEALKAIDEGGCDSLMRDRVRARNTKPGALWHIYNARDADKIREMLTEVAKERGEKLEANNDPIHDQCWYIDAELRQRLYRNYGVEGYAIAQCLGDAVFIPAGAPHQVRNLHSCVKVAEDFVSPENIAHCFSLTQEFRQLSDTHTNHEDKLQIKNIIYHVVRDSLSLLLHEGKSKEAE